MALKNKPSITTLTNTAAVVLSATSNQVITLSKVLACNTDSADRTVSIWHDVTGSGGAVTATQIIKNQPISAGETKTLVLSSVFLANGSKLYASADAGGAVNLDINYTTSEQAA